MKKYGILLGIVAFLVVAVLVNASINKGAAKKTPAPTVKIEAAGTRDVDTLRVGGEGYFETFRLNRANVRDEELAVLETIIIDKNADAETLADAQQQKLAIVDNMEKEFTVEALLKAKGFADVAVTFHPGAVNVILKTETLGDQQVAQVLDIVCRETGEPATSVKVSAAKG